jgi:hypothetical protein
MAGVFSLTRSLRSSTFACARTPFAPQSTRVGLGHARFNFVRPQARPFSAGYSAPRKDAKAYVSPIWRAAGVGAVGLGLASLTVPKKAVYCEPPSKYTLSLSFVSELIYLVTPASGRYGTNEPLPPPPSSSVRPYELTFGTVCGFCAGVFVKKGARAVAFMLGGLFVLLQVSRVTQEQITGC